MGLGWGNWELACWNDAGVLWYAVLDGGSVAVVEFIVMREMMVVGENGGMAVVL